MSRIATDWAWKQGLKPSLKLVLLSMADRAGESHECYPSIARLCHDTGLERKTVISAIGKLESLGLIKDTGERKGSTGRVKVYQIVGILEQYQKRNDSKNGTLNSAENGTMNSAKNGTLNQSLESPNRTNHVSQAKPDFSPVIDKWNGFAEKTGLQQLKGITTVRRKKIRSAYKLYRQTSIELKRQPKIKDELEFAETLIEVAMSTHTEFHLGKNDRGWRMNFDYLLQNKIVDRVTEHGSIEV